MGIYERVLESKIKGMNWGKKMAYLVSSVSCQCLCAVFWPFQRDLVDFRFADFLSIYNLPKVGYCNARLGRSPNNKTAVNSPQKLQSSRNST